MGSIRTIVVATDFSRTSVAAIERGAHLAVQEGAALYLLHALPDAHASGPDGGRDGAQGPAAAAAADEQSRQALAASAMSLSRRLSVHVATHCEAGPPASVIAAFAQAHPGSLIVVGSRADVDLDGLGSTASEVVRSPAAPTLVVRALEHRPYGTVLSAVDLGAGSVRAASLAVELFPQAQHHLLHALDPLAAEADPSGNGIEDGAGPDPDVIGVKAELECRRLARQLSAATTQPVHAVVADDAPERAILVAAAELDADCVVVGHHGDGEPTNAVLGSMAEHIVHSAISDVLVVV